MTPDALSDFAAREIELEDRTKRVYVGGTGPAVIVMAEMPGISPDVIRFARWVREAGFTVYLPSLFGIDGALPTAQAGASVFKQACINREFQALGAGRASPVTTWLRALARLAHGECGGPGVGAVGMCFTGNFAMAMMTEPAVVAPVLSQPSLPLPLGAARKAAMGLSPDEISCAKRRFTDEGLSAIGLRFHGDPTVPPERFETFKATFGDAFEAIELDAKDGRLALGRAHPHSVLTINLQDDDPDGPTKKAEERVIAFFKDRTAAA